MSENNYVVEVKGKIMTITVDLSKDLGRSASGKNTLIASTKGNQFIDKAGVTMGLNIYKK
jgi:hypothetical protein